MPHVANVPPTNAVLNITVYPIGTPVIGSPNVFRPRSSLQRQWCDECELHRAGFDEPGLDQLGEPFFILADDQSVSGHGCECTNLARFYRVQKN